MKLDEAPEGYMPLDKFLNLFHISRSTYWRYVKLGLLSEPETYKAEPSKKAKKVWQGFVPKELATVQMLKILRLRSLGLSMAQISKLEGQSPEFIKFADEIAAIAPFSLSYLSPIFRFDKIERLYEFYDVYGKQYGGEWKDDLDNLREVRMDLLEREMADLVARGDLELQGIGSTKLGKLRFKLEQEWLKKNWDIYQEIAPAKLIENLKLLYESMIRSGFEVSDFSPYEI